MSKCYISILIGNMKYPLAGHHMNILVTNDDIKFPIIKGSRAIHISTQSTRQIAK